MNKPPLPFAVIALLLQACSPTTPAGVAAPGQSAPAHVAPARYDIEQLMGFDELGGLAFSPDGTTLSFTSKRTGVANLYTLPVGGGTPTALTDSSESISNYGYFPDGQRMLYGSDRGGNEIVHVFVRAADGAVRDLTPGDRVKARFVGWAHDGGSFFIATNERDPRHFDLYEYAADDYRRRPLFRDEGAYQARAVSPDRSRVALSRIHDNAHTDCFLYHTQQQRLERLHPAGQRITCEPQVFSSDGRYLFLTSDEGREFQRLLRRDLNDGTTTEVLAPDWDVQGAGLSRDGQVLFASVNQDARTVVHLFDPATLQPRQVLDPGPATVAGFAVSPLGAVATIESDGNLPGDLFLSQPDGARERLIDSLPPGVAASDLVPGRVVRFASYDGVQIPGILYVPHGATAASPGPAAVWVHGGPGGESRIGFKPMVQYLVNHGYVVYEINNRGSSGSGKTFYHLDDGRHGSADLDDVVASRQMLIDTGVVDPDRIAIMGGSYGGYMTLAALTFRPDAFAAGVNIYGVSNWVRLLSNTPVWWEDLRRLLKTEMGDWERDPARFHAISPAFHAQNIRKPLLVLQGANDPRVLPVESEDIVQRVHANGVPVEYIVFEDEGHSFRKKANQIVAYRAIRRFLDQHMSGTPTAPATTAP